MRPHWRGPAAWLLVALGVRLASLPAYPLTDPTEGRYADIARRMLATGEWVVPYIDPTTPFWGKPPLSFWMTAASLRLLGLTEFAARLPSLVTAVGAAALLGVLAPAQGRGYAVRAAAVCMTSALVFVSAGTVETDPTLFFGITLAMVALWRRLEGGGVGWAYLAVAGVAIGLLAKGPIALAITAIAVAGWAGATGRFRDAFASIPWLGACALLAALVLPWYVAAEVRSPGFLRYFLLGEHWQRFTVPGWQGDLYGAGHAYPRGTIWIMAALATLPWGLWLGARLATSTSARDALRGQPLVPYLLAWSLAPVILFTPARNILPAYVLPGLGAFAALVALAFDDSLAPPRRAVLGYLMPAVLAGALIGGADHLGARSERSMVAAYLRDRERHAPPLLYLDRRPYSAAFYADDRVGRMTSLDALAADPPPRAYVVVPVAAARRLAARGDVRSRVIRTSADGREALMLVERVDRPRPGHREAGPIATRVRASR